MCHLTLFYFLQGAGIVYTGQVRVTIKPVLGTGAMQNLPQRDMNPQPATTWVTDNSRFLPIQNF